MTLRELDERILEDDYPVFGDFYYVVDGRVVRSDWHEITVLELKVRLGGGEVRRCDTIGRLQREGRLS